MSHDGTSEPEQARYQVFSRRLPSLRQWAVRRFSLQLGAIPFVLLVCATLIALDVSHVWGQRAEDLAEARKETANLALSLGQQAEDTVRTGDIAILGLVQRLEIDGAGPETLAKLRQIMMARLNAFPTFASFVIADATGKCLIIGSPTMPDDCSLAGHADYEYHRKFNDPDVRLSPPVHAFGSSTWVIPLSRRFNRLDGSFGGVVVIGISIPYLAAHYGTFDIGQHGAILLALRDGTLLVRRPFVEADIGRSLLNGGLFHDLLSKSPIGTGEITSSTDGVVRLNSYRLQEAHPLVIAVAESMDDLLAPWRAALLPHLAITTALTMIIGFLGVRLATQIRERRRVESDYRLLADNSTDVVLRVGPDLKRVYVSPSIRDLTGHKPEELLNLPHGGLIHPDDRASWATCFAHPNAGTTKATYRMARKDGVYVWVEATGRQIPDGGFVASVRDISARKEAEDRLTEANQRLEVFARQDGLTGLANRRQFDETLEAEFRRALREKTSLSLIMIDVDHFKAFNDHYGHPAGDRCLKRIALALTDASQRPGDLSARYGGEEFVLLLPNTSEAGALAVAKRAQCAVRSLELEHCASPAKIVTISLGIASLAPGQGRGEAGDLVKAADGALYASKERGRDTVSSMTTPADAA